MNVNENSGGRWNRVNKVEKKVTRSERVYSKAEVKRSRGYREEVKRLRRYREEGIR